LRGMEGRFMSRLSFFPSLPPPHYQKRTWPCDWESEGLGHWRGHAEEEEEEDEEEGWEEGDGAGAAAGSSTR
jgi:hypothetical protein